MSKIDSMPPMCHDCPRWELCKFPYVCPDTEQTKHKMRKRITVILEVETDDDINISDEFIQDDLKQEINCTSNSYDIISIHTEPI